MDFLACKDDVSGSSLESNRRLATRVCCVAKQNCKACATRMTHTFPLFFFSSLVFPLLATMPELPEVESFRRLLLPLVSTSTALTIELIPLDATNTDGAKKPHRYFVRQEEVLHLSNHVYLVDVQRKGKLMCMILQGIGGGGKDKSTKSNTKLEYFYLFLHMGMTGRISTPNRVITLKSMERSRDNNNDDDEVEEYPPKHTFIRFQCGSHEACFSDPRRFGWVAFKASLESGFDELAPDSLWVLTGSSSTADTDTATTTVDTEDARQKLLRQLTNQRVAIKQILLDQKRVISGIGNWIADEVLYQSRVHPEQTHLSESQVRTLLDNLKTILVTAIDCLVRGDDFPSDWIFHVRWRTSNSPSTVVKDSQGRVVEFLITRARTAAIVPSIQKLKKVKATIKDNDDDDEGERGKKGKKRASVGDKKKGKASIKEENISVATEGKKRKILAHPVRRSKRANP